MTYSKSVVIKLGSQILTDSKGKIDNLQISKLVAQIVELRKAGVYVYLVSSGAVAAGRSIFDLDTKTTLPVQVLASVGQSELIQLYKTWFTLFDIKVGQVLVTKEDFRDRRHFLNLKGAFGEMKKNDILPIINENDVISIPDKTFSDNDELASLVAAMTDCQQVVILSSIDGFFDGDPKDEDSKVIPTVNFDSKDIYKYVQKSKSELGRGGMASKLESSMKNANLGIETIIASGFEERVLNRILIDQEFLGTKFLAMKNRSSKRKWVAHNQGFEKGSVVIDQGAEEMLANQQAISLLPVGIKSVEGKFAIGDIVKILNHKLETIGYGVCKINSENLDKIKGEKNQKVFIHYDEMYVIG